MNCFTKSRQGKLHILLAVQIANQTKANKNDTGMQMRSACVIAGVILRANANVNACADAKCECEREMRELNCGR